MQLAEKKLGYIRKDVKKGVFFDSFFRLETIKNAALVVEFNDQ